MARRRILNIEVDDLTLQEFLEQFDAGFVVTPNVDHLVMLQSRPDFLEVYRRADFATVDSQIVKWALGFLGTPVKARLSGSDVFPAFCNFHGHDPEVKIFLLGGRDDVAEAAARRINARIGRPMVVGWRSPSLSFVTDEHEVTDVIAQIEASGANVLAVGLGAPKQELWIDTHRHRLPSIRRFMAVGATLDFEAGKMQRAPALVSQAGMEWLHRLLSEPGRLWHRYLVRDPKFLWLVLLQRFGLYRDPHPRP